MKTCIFADVEHLRHAIQGIFPEVFPGSLFTAEPYLPQGAKWENFFKFLAAKCGGKFEVDARWMRAYWYVTEDIVPFPRLPSPKASDSRLAAWTREHRAALARLLTSAGDGDSAQFIAGVREADRRLKNWMSGELPPGTLRKVPDVVGDLKRERAAAPADISGVSASELPGVRDLVEALGRGTIGRETRFPPEMRESAGAVVHALWGRVNRAKAIFQRQQWAQDDLARKCRSLEFRRSGSVGFDVFADRCMDEKTVDANLSLDMLLLKDIYDVAVILSGDQDFVPAARAAKNAGKIVVNAAFYGGRGRGFFPKGAEKLNQVVDWRIIVDHADFRKYLGLDNRPDAGENNNGAEK